MRLKPNDTPDMIVGESRRASFHLSGAVGANTITDFTITSDRMTFGTPSISGTNVSVMINATNAGIHWIKATAVLSSEDTVIGMVRAKVTDCSNDGRDY